MTRYFLQKLALEGFRGINNEGAPLELDFKIDVVNSVFAPNGVGKSSVFEALQFALRGKVERLSSMQSAERADNYIANLFHSKKRSTISMTFTPDDATASIEVIVSRDRSGKVTVTSPNSAVDPVTLLSQLNEDYALLDYQRFAQFIDDTALERGRSFSALIGLGDYSAFRRSLSSASNKQTFRTDFGIPLIEQRRSDAADRERRALMSIREIAKTSPEDQTFTNASAESIATELLRRLQQEPMFVEISDRWTDLGSIDFDQLIEMVSAAEGGEDRSQLIELKSTSTKLDEVAESGTSWKLELAALQALLDEYSSAVANAVESDKRALLTAAHDYFKQHDPSPVLCPVCEQQAPPQLAGTVQQRADAYATIDTAETAFINARRANVALRFLAALEGLNLETESTSVDGGNAVIAVGGLGIPSAADFAVTSDRIETLSSLLSNKRTTLASTINELERRLPASAANVATNVSNAKAALGHLSELSAARAGLAKEDSQLQIFEGWFSFISKFSESYAVAETAMTERTLRSLEARYQSVFSRIMPTNDVIPRLTHLNGGEKVDVALTSFHGAKNISAKAVLSESYRNALALSVFLAAATHHQRAPRFVVLDDVTSSFDAGHQLKMMEELRQNLQFDGQNDGVQFIILSHDVTLEKYFDRLGDGSQWHHQKLHGAPPFTRISTRSESEDRLKAAAVTELNAGEIDRAAGFIRQYLEFVLQQVIRKLAVPVPIDLALTDHRKMAGDCLDAITNAVADKAALGTIILTPQQVKDLTKRHVPAIVANWVSHYGTSGASSFNHSFLLGVIQDIDDLRKCFQYDAHPNQNGDWRFYKSLTRK